MRYSVQISASLPSVMTEALWVSSGRHYFKIGHHCLLQNSYVLTIHDYLKITIFWCMLLCIKLEWHHCFRASCCFPEDGGTRFFCNIGTCPLNCMATHHRKPWSLWWPWWGPEMW